MKDTAVTSTVLSLPAMAATAAHWLGQHVPDMVMYMTLAWTSMNVAALTYKFYRWTRK